MLTFTVVLGTRASSSVTSCDFFFQSERPTQYQETHSTLKEKKVSSPEACFISKTQQFELLSFHSA